MDKLRYSISSDDDNLTIHLFRIRRIGLSKPAIEESLGTLGLRLQAGQTRLKLEGQDYEFKQYIPCEHPPVDSGGKE